MSQYMFVVSGEIDWTEARDAAVARGGQLVSVNDIAEDAFIREVLDTYDALWGGEPRDTARNGPWIGLTQAPGSAEPGAGWGWLDGTALAFNGWHPTQPDNFIADTVAIYWDNDGAIGWADHINAPTSAGFGPVISYAAEFGDATVQLTGGATADFIFGGAIGNRIEGGKGGDVLDGGGGADTLTGGRGRDTYVFADAAEADGDRVLRLETRDRLDFSQIDAREGRRGDQRFERVAAFDGTAGRLTVTFDGVDTVFAGDTDGDGLADFEVFVAGDQTGFTGLIL